MCHGSLDFESVGERFGIDFGDHFALEVERLRGLQADGLLEMDEEGLRVTPRGMLLVRVVAMVFDEFLQRAETGRAFSRVI